MGLQWLSCLRAGWPPPRKDLSTWLGIDSAVSLEEMLSQHRPRAQESGSRGGENLPGWAGLAGGGKLLSLLVREGVTVLLLPARHRPKEKVCVSICSLCVCLSICLC